MEWGPGEVAMEVWVGLGIKWWWTDIHGVEWSVWHEWNGVGE